MPINLINVIVVTAVEAGAVSVLTTLAISNSHLCDLNVYSAISLLLCKSLLQNTKALRWISKRIGRGVGTDKVQGIISSL